MRRTSSFDVVLSTFGVMFTPDQQRAAQELLRVCRPGGKIGLANWTPESFIGRLFKIIAKYVPPAPGVKSPALWGSWVHLDTLFGSGAAIAAEKENFVFRYKSPEHWVEIFRTYYGPVHKAFAAIDAKAMMLERTSRRAAARMSLSSVMTDWPTPSISFKRWSGALTTSAKEPKRAINCFASSLVSHRGSARNSTSSSSS